MTNTLDKFERVKSLVKLGYEVNIVEEEKIVHLSLPTRYNTNREPLEVIPFDKLDDFNYMESKMKKVMVDEKELEEELLKEVVSRESEDYIIELKKSIDSLGNIVSQFTEQ